MLNKIWRIRGARFVVVGVTNTIIDFSILNFLVFSFGLNKFVANSISVSVAMLASYLLNNHLVFKHSGKDHLRKLLIFLSITAFGMFVIQNFIIYLFVHAINFPADIATTILQAIGLNNLSHEFITLNLAKLLATAVTMVWNYFMYRKFVFTNLANS